MKNYKFRLKKIITNTVELKAENYKEALAELIEFLEIGDKEIFEKSKDKTVDYDIILEKIKSKNDIKSLKNIKEILETIRENDEENDAEYTEILCDKCGNCIRLDDEFMS